VASGERVLVVGGTRGTGLLIARLLSGRGYRVRVLARNPRRAKHDLGEAIEVVAGDITKPGTLRQAVEGADHIVFTAGARSGRCAPERLVKSTDHDGLLNTLAAVLDAGFAGRFLYMNSIGIRTWSVSAMLINLLKRNTLVWRRRVEQQIRASGVDYTIIRVGFLTNGPAGRRAVAVGQDALPLSPRHRIARADVAQAFAAALEHPKASRTSFEIVWGRGEPCEDWSTALGRLKPDP
jgi:uncharacterized protein YbjT (DUF2867 family)